MYANITAMRVRGKAIGQDEIRRVPTVHADIIVSNENVTSLGRYSKVATVKSGSGGMDDLLPPLYDCGLSHMGTNGFVLSGIELVGEIAYAQAWWCRPL
jgi:hypothetical protein